MEDSRAWVFLVPIVLAGLLLWFRAGHGGSLGRTIRESDHWAWQDAVDEKKRELTELMNAEPSR